MKQDVLDAAIADFSHAIGLLVRRLRSTAASQELSWTDVAVLKRLGKDGQASTADLARAEGMKPQSMGTIIAALEEAGMVERKSHRHGRPASEYRVDRQGRRGAQDRRRRKTDVAGSSLCPTR